MSFPPYPNYQDSGIEWLAKVPSHWEVTRLKKACEVFPSNVDKKTVEGQRGVHLCNYTDVYYNDEIVEGMSFMEASATDEQIERFQLRAGDTIFTKDSETPDDIARSAYVPADLPGVICGYHLSMARPNPGTCGPFIKRYFDASTTRAYFHVKANGLTRVGLGQYAVDNAPIALPPLDEQVSIAAFLDHETAKIDALLVEQRRLIELLKEKRQAVISHAVTNGLDPTVPMKDSGVEWLGDVPAHWDVNRLDRLMSFSSGKAHEPFLDDDGQHVYISARFVSTHGQSLKFCTENLTPAKRGDVVMVMSDSPNGRALARAYQIADDASYAVNQRVCRLNGFRGSARYFYYQLDRNPGLRRYDDGVNQTHLSNSAYRKLLLCAPPEAEQAKIAKYLDELTGQIDDLQVAATSAVSVLQERRAALISAAVTGKIDVRGALTKQAEAA